MPVETAIFINTLDAANPTATDLKSEGDDHLRLVKAAIKATFPNVAGAVTPTHVQFNFLTGVTSAIQGQLDSKAPTASPTFTGTAVLPTATSIGAVSAAEIGFLSGVTSGIQGQFSARAPLASPAFSGVPTAPTAPGGTSTTQLATTAFVISTGLSSALPGQAGNAGRFVTTDGSNASWAPIDLNPIYFANNVN